MEESLTFENDLALGRITKGAEINAENEEYVQ
jgi:hypothetical protein